MISNLRKRPLPLHALGPDDLALDFTHRWWRARRDGSLLPSRSAVDTPEFRLLVDGAWWVDVTTDGADSWPLGRLTGLLVGLPAKAAAAAATSLRSDLRAIRFTGAVLLQDLTLQMPTCARRWRQLILPHADDGTRVRALLVVLARQPAQAAVGPLSAEGQL